MNYIEQASLSLNTISAKAYDSPKEAMKELSELAVPNELLHLRDAVLTHLIWCKQAEMKA